ncbi:MAG: hypothetical protein AAGF20_03440 [Pseudomonadota bacterium]
MRKLVSISVLFGCSLVGIAQAQTIEETEKAVDCLALTEVAKGDQSIPDTAKVTQWRDILRTSEYCQTPEEGVDYRIAQYREALSSPDPAYRMAIELMVESEALKCATGAPRTRFEEGI